MRIPVSTYRLQINEDFTLHDARDIVPYLVRLGISDLYLSPVFEARTGSTHGYDVTNPTRIREAIGGEDALRGLADEAAANGMGILLDIVPNHMAASPENPWWRDVLENGRRSRFAHFFDIDWASNSGRLRLPILGDTLDAVIERGEISIDPDAGELVYFDTRLPLSAGSVTAARGAVASEAGTEQAPTRIPRSVDMRDLLHRQHYELVFWQTASRRMNYRRFFDITDLAGVRVEDAEVFDASHALIRTLAAEGVITGLRIDHIDGLRDPAAYLRMLRRKVRGPGGEPVYTVVEKILERDEALPPDWQCEGTTGYEFLSLATGVMLDPAGHEQLGRFWRRIAGTDQPFHELVRDKKLLVMDRLFASEVAALASSLARLTALDEDAAASAVTHVTASMSVYRTYVRSREISATDRRRMDAAVEDARRRNPGDAAAIDTLYRVITLDGVPVDDATLDWVMRWQQLTGPVMAKGFEDTALYCHNALLAANDVGSDPVHAVLPPAALHTILNERASTWPHSLSATATHDTKRGEDTRARIAVLSELPGDWQRLLRRWTREGEEWKAEIADEISEDEDITVPDADVDSLLYQTLVGAWPLDGATDDFTARIQEYMTKAVREAKEQTSWRRPDEDYEQALAAFIDRVMEEFGREGLAEEVASFARDIAPHGALNALAQTLLRITAPGIPDTYQGTELWSFTLVDPDNRRAVDFGERRRILDALGDLPVSPEPERIRTLFGDWQDGSIKLFLLCAALHCRNRHSDVFSRGRLVPLEAHGSRRDHALAFARELDGDACIIAVPRLTVPLARGSLLPTGSDVWGDTHLGVPASLAGQWKNALTGELIGTADGRLGLDRLFATVPIALLERA